MDFTIGIRREDKSRWERRVPLVPRHVKELKEKYGIETMIQPSPIRVFSDDAYIKAGASVQEDISESSVVFAVKEIPINFFNPEKTYVFFSHTIKGQKHNMPMLKKMIELGCTLIDYEKIADKSGRRLVFFGRFAGIAGMVDTLWAFGQHLEWMGIKNPFSQAKKAIYYLDLPDILEKFRKIGENIKSKGLPKSLTPLVIGIAGYGNVSRGVQEVLDVLPIKEIKPDEIKSVYNNPSNKYIYKVVFKEKDMVEPIDSKDKFKLQDYYSHPEKYRSVFEKYVPYLSILMNCIYWNTRYPRLVTKKYLKNVFSEEKEFRLKVIGDISCDINGAIECTVKATSQDSPVFVYIPMNDKIVDGYAGDGVVVMAVDNLPCELPKESSEEFSKALYTFVPHIMNADFSEEKFENLDLPFQIKNAMILYKGRFTPNYKYMEKYLVGVV